MTIEVKDIVFPSFDDFAKAKTFSVLDYRFTFSQEVRETTFGKLAGVLSFYVTSPGFDKYRGKPITVNESNYEVIKREIRENRLERIRVLADG